MRIHGSPYDSILERFGFNERIDGKFHESIFIPSFTIGHFKISDLFWRLATSKSITW